MRTKNQVTCARCHFVGLTSGIVWTVWSSALSTEARRSVVVRTGWAVGAQEVGPCRSTAHFHEIRPFATPLGAVAHPWAARLRFTLPIGASGVRHVVRLSVFVPKPSWMPLCASALSLGSAAVGVRTAGCPSGALRPHSPARRHPDTDAEARRLPLPRPAEGSFPTRLGSVRRGPCSGSCGVPNARGRWRQRPRSRDR